MTSVHIRNLRFGYGDKPVLDIPSLDFGEGRVTALLGPNGAGKSTLLRVIAGLERPTTGELSIGNHAVRGARDASHHVAFAFQDSVFLRGTVAHNLDFALRMRGVAPVERRTRATELADALGFTALLKRSPSRISVGEARRVNLARALALRAPVTLLDEPLAALDTPTREALLGTLPAILRRYAGTTILVTHDRGEAVRLADDIVIIIDGRVRLAAPRQAAFSNPPDRDTAAFLGYSVIRSEGDELAIAPGSLTLGPGELTFPFTVEAVLRTPAGHDMLGDIFGVRLSIGLGLGAHIPEAGATVTVSAPSAAVLRFPSSAAGNSR